MEGQRAFNLTVDGIHTFYVAAGAKDILVHNCPKASGGRLAQLAGDAYEKYLLSKLGGGGGFSEMGRQFDGAFIDSATGRGTWYEAKSGQFWEAMLRDPKRLSKFFSNEGQKLQIANKYGVAYVVISQHAIPKVVTDWLAKKGISWRVIP